jgi:anti-anti-sigma regulatory factor
LWRIQRIKNGEAVVFRLSGRLQAEELGQLQEALGDEPQDQAVVLDLKEIRLVDQEAVAFLAKSEVLGTRIVNCPEYVREWMGKSARPGKESGE